MTKCLQEGTAKTHKILRTKFKLYLWYEGRATKFYMDFPEHRDTVFQPLVTSEGMMHEIVILERDHLPID